MICTLIFALSTLAAPQNPPAPTTYSQAHAFQAAVNGVEVPVVVRDGSGQPNPGLTLASLDLQSPAQEADKKASSDLPEIRGTVREAGSLVPLSEVEVQLFGEGKRILPSGALFQSIRQIASTKTDMSGAFSFQPETAGVYIVGASKKGYFRVSGNPSPMGGKVPIPIDVKSGGHLAEVTIVLGRMEAFEGQILDADTQRPIPHLGIVLSSIVPAWGIRRLAESPSSPTDSEGRFRISKTPSEYILAIHPQVWDKPRLLTQFSEEDRKAVVQDYEETYWPGTTDSDTAVPIAVRSGEAFNLGVLRVRKVPYYSVHVSLPEDGCAAGEKVQVRIPNNLFGKAGRDLGTAVCGKDFLLTGFAPGSYRLEITPVGSRPREQMTWGEASFDIADQNLDITVTMKRGIDVEGKIVVADGSAKPAFEKMRITLLPVVGDRTQSDLMLGADAEGRLRITNVRATEHWIGIEGVPEGYCIRQVRYNGSVIRGRLLPLQTGGVSRSLEIVLDDKPAAVAGTVMEGDRPVTRAEVLLTPWPVDSPNAVWPPRQTTAGGDGKFQFSGLAPGDYLVFSLSPAMKEKWREPGVLGSLLRRATKVTLEGRGFQTLTLSLSDLR